MGIPAKKQDHRAAQAVALTIVLGLAWMSQDRSGTPPEKRRELAARYRFERHALPEVASDLHQNVRPCNPTCANISAWVSSIGAGTAIGDLDGDGTPNDIVYADPRTEQVIVCPAPGTPARYAPFALTQGGAGKPYVGCSGAMIGDYDEDGRADLLVYFMGRAPVLFLRKPGSTVLDAAAYVSAEPAAGLDDARWYTAACAQGDVDGDGRVDIVVGNFFPDQSETYNPQAKSTQEMHNSHGWASNGGGLHVLTARKPTADNPHRFAEQPLGQPDNVLHGWVLGLVVADLDGDYLPEIFSVNDLGPDRLLHNRSTPGKLRFQLVHGEESATTPGSFSLGRDTYHGMGGDVADLNHDGTPDMFISNITCRFGLQESQTMWMSRPGRSFADAIAPYQLVSEKMGVARTGWGWDAKFESFANTVMPDLVQAVGFLKGPINRWPELQALAAGNTAYLRDGRNWPTFRPGSDLAGDDLDPFFVFDQGRYHNVNRELAGFDQPMVSRGIAPADVDGDGRMDLAIANQFGPSYFFRNQSTQVGKFLGLRIVQPTTDQKLAVLPGRPPVRGRPAYGATASLTLPCGTPLARAIDGGNGHGGHRSAEVHFGLGDYQASEPIAVTVRWRDRNGNLAGPAHLKLAANQWHTIVLGEVSK